MTTKSFALEFYLVFFTIAALAEKLQSGRMILAWLILGAILGITYSNDSITKLIQEMLIGVIGLFFTLITLYFVVGIELFEDKNVNLHNYIPTPQFLFIIWQVGFSGLLVISASYMTHGIFHKSEEDKLDRSLEFLN